MKKHTMACVKCAETRILMRKADNERLSKRRLHNIRICMLGLILIAISLVYAVNLSGVVEGKLETFGMTAGIATVILFLIGCYLLVFSLVRKELYHYKCSKCSFTWDC